MHILKLYWQEFQVRNYKGTGEPETDSYYFMWTLNIRHQECFRSVRKHGFFNRLYGFQIIHTENEN